MHCAKRIAACGVRRTADNLRCSGASGHEVVHLHCAEHSVKHCCGAVVQDVQRRRHTGFPVKSCRSSN